MLVAMVLLSVEKVSKSRRSGLGREAVLREISLSLEPGECMAVWGGRSSGKTTLLNVIAGREAPELGRVRLEGVDVHRSAPAGPRMPSARIGWARSAGPEADRVEALDYVAHALLPTHSPRRAWARSWETLAHVGLARRARARCGELTAAERVRVWIARALGEGPRLLLADEPAADLSPAERESVVALLRSLAELHALAVLLTVSDIPSLVQAHRVGSLSDGWLLSPDSPGPRDKVVNFPLRSCAVR
jgi:ABC-type multidrug transport system ATPase subunit